MRIAGAAPGSRGATSPTRWRPTAARSTTDHVARPPTSSPIGVAKQSFVSGLYASGQATGYYAPPGADPGADLTRWFAQINAGEPYDADERAIADELAAHHSPYYLDHSRAPAPPLIANGWTDDLFPADEALRFYNRTRAQYPAAPLALMFFDFGHQRGQNKDADVARFAAARVRVDRPLRQGRRGRAALQGVEALTQTCPKDAPSGGPFDAPTWKALHPGEVRFSHRDGPRPSPRPAATRPSARAFDPIAGGGALRDDERGRRAGHRGLPAAGGDRRRATRCSARRP